MALRTAAVFVLLQRVSSAEASLSTPVTCYILDGFLLLYCIVFTGLFFREKLLHSTFPSNVASNTDNDANGNYEEQNLADPSSGAIPKRRQEEGDRTYQTLGDVESDPYQMIESTKTKSRARKVKKTEVYESLNLDTKTNETYQPLAKRPSPPSPPGP
ncbi:CD247 antigen like isoform X1 [Osmerus mordax]|uniref:CD247 antigen like isoform X1 n=1 Tax=Osmerus mordax TaxID=8014 RepID=UPI00350FD5F2